MTPELTPVEEFPLLNQQPASPTLTPTKTIKVIEPEVIFLCPKPREVNLTDMEIGGIKTMKLTSLQ